MLLLVSSWEDRDHYGEGHSNLPSSVSRICAELEKVSSSSSSREFFESEFQEFDRGENI